MVAFLFSKNATSGTTEFLFCTAGKHAGSPENSAKRLRITWRSALGKDDALDSEFE